MASLAHLLKQARSNAGLSLERFAAWARLPADVLRDVEEGTRHLSFEEADRCARVFGLRLDDLLAGEAGTAPMTVLLRSNADFALEMREIFTTEIDEALGELQRVVRDIADLERAIGFQPPQVPRLDGSRCPAGVHPGEHRAQLVRRALGLGDGPIPSMSALAERLGVRIVWVTEEQVDKLVDGACVITPRPAVLVNLLDAGNPHPWRARISLAHELGHILFDLAPGSAVAVSPHMRRLPKHLEEVEQTARAFAACLLAPADGVRRVIGDLDPASDEAVRTLGSQFGVGRTVAINRLQHVFSLTNGQRDQMERRAAPPYLGDFGADRPPEVIGFRGEPLLGLVRQAVQQGAIPTSRARRILGLTPAEELPFPELGDASRPALAPEHRIVRKVMTYLAERGLDLAPGSPEREGDHFRVPLLEGGSGPGARGSRGSVLVSLRGELVQELIDPPR